MAQSSSPSRTSANDEAHWRKTTNLMLGFPLGFYMAAQGSLIVFVVMLFMFARQQDKIDREFGVAEDD
jgi:putative solute:sodium symporter small subunit